MKSIDFKAIPWIVDLPKSWEIKPTKYLIKKIKEIIPFYNDEDVISLSMNGVHIRDLDAGGKMPKSFSGYQKVKPGDLLMCLFDIDVTPRCVGVVNDDGITSPAYSRFKMEDGVNVKYYYYFFLVLDNTKELVYFSKNLRYSLTEDELGKIKVIHPPFEEQKAIADFLDDKCAQIDEITKDLEKKINKSEEYKKVLIKDAVTKGINNAELVDCGVEWIGSIPKHWQLIPNKYLFIETTDKVGKHWTNYNLLSLTTSGVKIKDINNIGGKMPDNYEKYLIIKKGQMIFCLFDLDMSAVFAGIATADGMITSAYNAYNTTELIDKRFANYFFQFAFINRTYKLYSKNIRYTVTTDVFNAIKTVVPPLPEQKAIADFLDDKCAQIDEITKATREEIETLKQYKQSLIFEYVTGKKEVPNE